VLPCSLIIRVLSLPLSRYQYPIASFQSVLTLLSRLLLIELALLLLLLLSLT
jgi:hypothetical protein